MSTAATTQELPYTARDRVALLLRGELKRDGRPWQSLDLSTHDFWRAKADEFLTKCDALGLKLQKTEVDHPALV